jgi:hypothetical protein
LPHAIQRDIVSTAWWDDANYVYDMYLPTPCDDCTRWTAINWYAQQVDWGPYIANRQCNFCTNRRFQLFMAKIYEYSARTHVWEIEEDSSSDEEATNPESTPEDVL